MRIAAVITGIVLALTIAVHAEPQPQPAMGFWKILVAPHARWVLHETIEGSKTILTVETYDVRKLGAADVARIRWTTSVDKSTTDVGGSDGRFTQVAVTDAGLYLLSADMDDKAVLAALAKKPDRSDPPRAYEGTKR